MASKHCCYSGRAGNIMVKKCCYAELTYAHLLLSLHHSLCKSSNGPAITADVPLVHGVNGAVPAFKLGYIPSCIICYIYNDKKLVQGKNGRLQSQDINRQ
jgi:hypothetical protein